jgi:hypothetical protein
VIGRLATLLAGAGLIALAASAHTASTNKTDNTVFAAVLGTLGVLLVLYTFRPAQRTSVVEQSPGFRGGRPFRFANDHRTVHRYEFPWPAGRWRMLHWDGAPSDTRQIPVAGTSQPQYEWVLRAAAASRITCVAIVPEPRNRQDPNAHAVVVSWRGFLGTTRSGVAGYIPADFAAELYNYWSHSPIVARPVLIMLRRSREFSAGMRINIAVPVDREPRDPGQHYRPAPEGSREHWKNDSAS